MSGSKCFVPELGHAAFGQPCKSYEASALLLAALTYIQHRLDALYADDPEWESPFGNNGCVPYDFGAFQVEGYDWNEDRVQPWNFKCGPVEVSWYKWFARDVSVNFDLTADQTEGMLVRCMEAIAEFERKRRADDEDGKTESESDATDAD